MLRKFTTLTFFLLIFIINSFSNPTVDKKIIIVCPSDATKLEQFAAREIRRYIYSRTGELLQISNESKITTGKSDYIIIARKGNQIYSSFVDPNFKFAMDSLESQQYWVRTLNLIKSQVIIVCGGDEIGTLYGAYRLIESFGVRFYLHGDVIPDKQIQLKFPMVDERAKPLFELRGIQPFHDFPEGPDWWNLDDYLAIISQLPKLRMNFFGLHTYPEGNPNAEPTVWIGLPNDAEADGKVKFSYPSSYQNTLRGNWGYSPKKTGDYYYGGIDLFERDDFGSDIMLNMCPQPQNPEASNEVFNRTGTLLNKVFQYAKIFGIKTCVGTETPLTIPKILQDKLKAAGKNPQSLSTIKEIYEGIFNRIKKTYPTDYYWFWTFERWTWSGVTDSQVTATKNDLLTAVEAAKNQNVPFKLATCGWVLGPPQDRAMFDNILPKDMPFSCINREVGFAPVDPSFARIKGRPKWAIPWLEDDPALTMPQLWVGRVRRDAADALKYECTGLMGIHWRTRILSPNVLALAYAGWDQSGWKKPLIEAIPVIKKEGPIGGRTASYYNNPIDGTTEDTLYQTLRYDLSGYHLSVPSGIYTVILKFCEPHYTAAGNRVFNVKIQGKEVLDKLDIFSVAGQNKALDYTFANVQVSDGWLDIDFTPIIEYPSIAAIVIYNNNYSYKINCGGPAFKDYKVDWTASVQEPQYMPTEDFYRVWVANQFGSEFAFPIAEIFIKIDGKLPRPADWVDGPGGLRPDTSSWEQVKKGYSFIDELELFRPRISGAGNLDRFDYWLNNFRYMKTTSQVKCKWAEYNKAFKKVEIEKDENSKKQIANQFVLPLRKDLVQLISEVYKCLIATISTTGELGTLMNWEQHILPDLLVKPGQILSRIIGNDLPEDAMPSKIYKGMTRIIVPTVRNNYTIGEDLNLKVIILSEKPIKESGLYSRELGKGSFIKVPLIHINRGVYNVKLTKEMLKDKDLEYYIKVIDAEGKNIYFPASAPKLNQTIVAREE